MASVVFSAVLAAILTSVTFAQPEGGDDEEETGRQFCPTPSAPTGLSATGGNRSISVSWNAVSAPPSGFYLHYVVSASSSTGSGGGTRTTTSTSASFSGLTNGASYTVSVRAEVSDDIGTECSSTTVSTTATPEAPSSGTPTPVPDAPAPSNARAGVSGSDTFSFSWNRVTGATQYQYEYSVQWAGWEGRSTASLTSVSITPSKSVILHCTNYRFRVRARGNGTTYSTTWGSWSSISELETGPPSGSTCPPAPAPTNLTASPGSISFSLRWNAVNGVAAYQYEYKVGDVAWVGPTSARSSTSATINLGKGVLPCTTYSFRVQAKGDGTPYSTAWGAWATTSKTTGPPPGGTCTPPTPEPEPTPEPTPVPEASPVPPGPPTFDEGISATRSVAENTASGTNIESPVSATDPNSDTLAYSLTGTDSGSFGIVSSSGQIQTSASLNYEGKSSYSVSVGVTDGMDSNGNPEQIPAVDATIAVTINVTDVNDPPEKDVTISSRTLTVNGSSARIGLANKFKDQDGDTLKYKAESDDTGIVTASVSGSTLTISPAGVGSANVTVTASDPGRETASQTFSVTVRAATPPPPPRPPPRPTPVPNKPPTITGPSSVNYGENDMVAVATYTASDPDSDTISWSVDGDDGGAMEISASGELTFKASPDYEDPQDDGTNNTYKVKVQVTDGKDSDGNTENSIDATIDVAITVTNAEETGTLTFSPSSPRVGQQITASLSDPDGVVQITRRVWSISSNGEDWEAIPDATGSSSYIPVPSDSGKWLRFFVQYTDRHGPNKTKTSSDKRVKLATPEIDLTPLHGRKATLTWANDPSANQYLIELQDAGGNWRHLFQTTVNGGRSGHRPVELVLELDDLFGLNKTKTLAKPPYAFEFRVKARLAVDTDSIADSLYSDSIIIIDTPIIRADGDSRNAVPSGSGHVSISRKSLSPILGPGFTGGTYSYRIRKFAGDAFSPDWRPNSFVSDDIIAENQISNVLLDAGDIYAIQLRYEVTTPSLARIRVYAARDAFVWPSAEFPEKGVRVGTFPFFGHWKDGHYEYAVCDATISPTNQRSNWVELIRHSFGSWQRAAPHLITITQHDPNDGYCLVDGLPISNEVPIAVLNAIYNERNEVYMIEPDTLRRFDPFLPLHQFFYSCIHGGTACVISPRYLQPIKAPGRELEEGSVDVLISADVLSDARRGTVIRPTVGNVQFNTCLPARDAGDADNIPGSTYGPDEGWFAYQAMLHEAGHALGVSEFRWWTPTSRGVAHSHVADSVMNYDSSIGFSEPDCFPHPFDIMALHALYQTAGQ